MAIQRLAEEDPTFRVHTDDETGQTIIAGMGELHLEVLIDRMKREFRVEANIGKPQVAYRETLRRAVQKVEYTHKKQSGGSGQYAKVLIHLEPLPTGSGYEFVNAITGSGNTIVSSLIGAAGSQRVSPVEVCLRPTAAAMSPA